MCGATDCEACRIFLFNAEEEDKGKVREHSGNMNTPCQCALDPRMIVPNHGSNSDPFGLQVLFALIHHLINVVGAVGPSNVKVRHHYTCNCEYTPVSTESMKYASPA